MLEAPVKAWFPTRLNPFARFENPRQVWAWGMFDLANQSFTLLINTLLFPLFFSDVIAAGDKASDFLWSLMAAVSLGLVVVASPILGALADHRAAKKKLLIASGLLCAVATCGLAFAPAGAPGSIALAVAVAMLLYIPANIAFNLGENFLASFLPEIATRATMGRISAVGWAMGYGGALILLGITAVYMQLAGVTHPAGFRPLLAFAGVWFFVMMIPTMLFLPESARPAASTATGSALGAALRRVRQTVREAAKFPDLVRLLTAFFIYGMGVLVIVYFASVIAKEDLGFDNTKLVILAGVLALMAGAAAILTGRIQDRIGHRRCIMAWLVVWTITVAALAWVAWRASTPAGASEVAMWIVGVGIGLGLGGIGTATRAAVGVFTPIRRTAEFFALWGMTYKLAGMVGLPIFGAVRSWAGSSASLLVLLGFFIVGGALLLRVREARGIGAAEAEDARAAPGAG